MLLGIFLAILLAWILLVLARGVAPRRDLRLPEVLVGGYLLRLLLSFLVRDLSLFAHGTGGDALLYEDYARLIVRLWDAGGIHYVNATELPVLGATTLPANVFALVFYVGGAGARIGCVAVVAFATALLFLNVFSLAVEHGARPRSTLAIVTVLYLSPLMLFYTSDTYKDGLVVCFAVGALGSSIRLSRRLSATHLTIGLLSLVALWNVRFYLVFVTSAPVLVGLVGLGSRSVTRPLLLALGLFGVGLALAQFTDILQQASERASETFAQGTASNVLEANASGGSGVTFDDGGTPFGAMLPKLAYTIFSPFPWAAGSLGFQVGKLDGLIWYYILVRAVRAVRQVWFARGGLVLMLLTFLVPCTLMYATSVANVGLIVRQRIVIVVVTAVLACFYTPKKAARTEASPAPGARDPGSTLARA